MNTRSALLPPERLRCSSGHPANGAVQRRARSVSHHARDGRVIEIRLLDDRNRVEHVPPLQVFARPLTNIVEEAVAEF